MLPNALTLAAMLAVSGSASAMTDAGLAGIVNQRLLGDRTGACFAVALIDGATVARTYRCADGTATPRIGADSAFEIGSVSKTMTAALLAQLIADGRASLDDPLSAYLPAGTLVPAFEGQPILLRHVVTHTSGLTALPARMQITNPADPDDMLFFQAQDKYVRVVTVDDDALIRTQLNELLAGLDPDMFWQVHRGIVVRVSTIDRVRRDELGKARIELRGHRESLPVSAAFVHRFRGM